jgi:hypothetical protein
LRLDGATTPFTAVLRALSRLQTRQSNSCPPQQLPAATCGAVLAVKHRPRTSSREPRDRRWEHADLRHRQIESQRRPLPIRTPKARSRASITRSISTATNSTPKLRWTTSPPHQPAAASPLPGAAADADPTSETRSATRARLTNRRRHRRPANASTARSIPTTFGGGSRHRGQANGGDGSDGRRAGGGALGFSRVACFLFPIEDEMSRRRR